MAATVTFTGPLVAPAGTGTVIELSLQLVGVAVVPLKVTVESPCLASKRDPMIVTTVPTGPEVGLIESARSPVTMTEHTSAPRLPPEWSWTANLCRTRGAGLMVAT